MKTTIIFVDDTCAMMLLLWTPEAFPGPNLRFPGKHHDATQETTAMLFAYTNATLLLKWSKERIP